MIFNLRSIVVSIFMTPSGSNLCKLKLPRTPVTPSGSNNPLSKRIKLLNKSSQFQNFSRVNHCFGWFISSIGLIIPRVETLKPQVKTLGWDKQPILIPPQLLVMTRDKHPILFISQSPSWHRKTLKSGHYCVELRRSNSADALNLTDLLLQYLS